MGDAVLGVILLALVAGGGIVVIDAFIIRKLRQAARSDDRPSHHTRPRLE